MSIRDLKYWEPFVALKVQRGFREQAAQEIRSRMISFRLEDDFRRAVDKAEIVLNNNDGGLMDPESLALGVVFRCAFGYTGAPSPPRIMQCRKIKGALRSGGLGDRSGPNTAAGGQVQLELFSEVWNMNMYRVIADARSGVDQQLVGTEEDRKMLFINKTVPDIVRELARTQGFSGTTALVEDLDGEQPLENTVIPADFSAAEWISDKAKERGWVFAIDSDGFHFHSPEWELADVEDEELTWFAGDPDVVKWDIEGDLNVPQNVQVRGGNVRGEAILGISRGPTAGVQGNENEVGFVRAPFLINDRGANGRRLSPDLLIATADPTRKQIQRVQRILNRRINRWKLKMTLVGNPNVKSRRKLNLKNFGPLADGRWTIRKAIHTVQANQVYFTEIEAVRRNPGGQKKLVLAVAKGPTGLRNVLTISTQ